MRDRLEQKRTLLEPEYCGLKKDAGNQIWWPDEKTKEADITVQYDQECLGLLMNMNCQRSETSPYISLKRKYLCMGISAVLRASVSV